MLVSCNLVNKPHAELSPTNLYQSFCQRRGPTFHPDEVQSLALAKPFISSSNKTGKPAIYRSASQGNEPFTIVVTTVRWYCKSERPSSCASPEVPEIISSSPPTSPGLLEDLMKTSKVSICKSERIACHNCCYYTVRLWLDRASVHLRFP